MGVRSRSGASGRARRPLILAATGGILETPAGYGEDQRWTLARVQVLIATLFHRRVSTGTVWQTMRRLGYTAQLPVHRAVERDEQAIAHWRRCQWPALKESRVG